MSVQGLIGAAAGGIIGFFVGGPVGAMYGAAVGFGIGSIFGMKSDEPAAGKPQVSEFNISTAAEGVLIADLLGTTKLTGNIFHYGNNRNEEIVQTSEAPSGGKGGMAGGAGSQSYVAGYRYYLTWAMGISNGPLDMLYSIYAGDKVVWSGALARPLSGGVETLTLTDMGTMNFYFGTDDQVANSVLGALLADATLNPAYRGLSYGAFHDCYIGDYNRAPVMRFVVAKTPLYDWTTREIIDTYFYNPACAVYYILVTKIGLDASYIHEDSFADVAEALHLESNGITLLMSRQQEALGYIDTILNHIDGAIYWGNDGKLHMKLVRADQSIETMPIVTQDMLLDDLAMERKSWLDTLNEVKVQYPQLITTDFYKLNVKVASGSGSVSPAVETQFQCNSNTPVVATPATNWFFEKWTGDVASLMDSAVASTRIKVPTYHDVDLWAWFTNLVGSSGYASRYFDCGAAFTGYEGVSTLYRASGLWYEYHPVYGPDYPFSWVARFDFATPFPIGTTVTALRVKLYTYGNKTGSGYFNWMMGTTFTDPPPYFQSCGGRYTTNDSWFYEYGYPGVETFTSPGEGTEFVLDMSASMLSLINAYLVTKAITFIRLEVYANDPSGNMKWFPHNTLIGAYKPKLYYGLA